METNRKYTTTIVIIILNVQGVNTPIKRKGLSEWIKDGGGIERGDHFLSYKFIERTIER